MKAGKFIWVFVAMTVNLCANAQNKTSVQTDSLLPEVMVTATRTSANSFLLPFSIEKEHAIAKNFRMPRTTPEALMQTSGVFVQKTNHGGGSAFLRGLTGNQTLLLLDGIRINNATFRYGPNQYLNSIDAYSISSMEVLKGSGSVQYGSDAMGGVIQLFAYNPEFSEKGKWFGSATTKIISSGMEQTAHVRTGYSTKNWTLQAGFTDRNFGDLYGGDSTGKQNPSGYKERDWELKAMFRLSKSMAMKLSSQKLTQTNVPLYHKVKLENFRYYDFTPQSLQISYAALDWNYGKKWMENLQLKIFQKTSEEGRNYVKNNSALWYEEFDKVNSSGLTLNVQSNYSGNWTANSGIEWYNDKVRSLRKKADLLSTFSGAFIKERGLYPDNAIQQNLSIYSLHHLNYRKWKFEPGIRYNAIANLLPSEIASLAPSQSKSNIKQNASAFVGNLSALYQMSTSNVVYASFNSGYRAPNIDDMGTLGLVDFRYEVPAYNLQPEKSATTELGYRIHLTKMNFHVAAYYTHIKDLISRVRKGTDSIQLYPVYIKTNDQVGYIKGIETTYEFLLARGFSLKGFLSTQYGQNLTRNEPMRRIPPTNGINNIIYKQSNWRFSLEHQWAQAQTRLAQGDKDDNRIPKGGTPGWQLWNFYAGYQTNTITVQASLNNIANTDYRLHGSGINGMGRAFVFSFKYDW